MTEVIIELLAPFFPLASSINSPMFSPDSAKSRKNNTKKRGPLAPIPSVACHSYASEHLTGFVAGAGLAVVGDSNSTPWCCARDFLSLHRQDSQEASSPWTEPGRGGENLPAEPPLARPLSLNQGGATGPLPGSPALLQASAL